MEYYLQLLGYSILIFVILVYGSSFYISHSLSKLVRMSEERIDLVPENFHTGDILLFKGCYNCRKKMGKHIGEKMFNYLLGKVYLRMFAICTQTIFTHCAIIIRINGVPYVCHICALNSCLDFRGEDMSGHMSIDNIDSLYECNGPVVIFKYTGQNTWSDDLLIDIINTTYKKNIIYTPLSRMFFSNLFKFYKPDKLKCCIDLLIHFLNELKILNEKNNNGTIMDVINITNNFDYTNGMYINNSCHC